MAEDTQEVIGPMQAFASAATKELSFEVFGEKLIVRKLVAMQAEKALILLAGAVSDAAEHVDSAASSLVEANRGSADGFDSKAVVGLVASVLGKKARLLATIILINLENAKTLGYIKNENQRFISDERVAEIQKELSWTLEMDQMLEVIAAWIDVEEPGKLLGNMMGLLGDKLGSLMPEDQED